MTDTTTQNLLTRSLSQNRTPYKDAAMEAQNRKVIARFVRQALRFDPVRIARWVAANRDEAFGRDIAGRIAAMEAQERDGRGDDFYSVPYGALFDARSNDGKTVARFRRGEDGLFYRLTGQRVGDDADWFVDAGYFRWSAV